MQYKNYGKNPIKSILDLGCNRKTKADDDYEDDDEGFSVKSGIYARKKSIMQFDYYLDCNITAPSNYRDILYTISHLSKDDEMDIYLDTGGGRLDATLRFISAIQETDGSVVVIGAGMAASAGAILFLQCPNVVVTPQMTMMLHAASYSAYGKELEVSEMVRFSEKTLKKLANDTYEGFLTALEITNLKMGKDYFFDAEEIIGRLEIREKFLSAKKVIKTVKPKPKAKAKIKTSK